METLFLMGVCPKDKSVFLSDNLPYKQEHYRTELKARLYINKSTRNILLSLQLCMMHPLQKSECTLTFSNQNLVRICTPHTYTYRQDPKFKILSHTSIKIHFLKFIIGHSFLRQPFFHS